jgi:hypothetical protein
MSYDPNVPIDERVEAILAQLYPKATPVSGLSIPEIAEMVAAKEARRKKKPAESAAPKSGFAPAGGTSYANPPGPPPKRPRGMTKAELQGHLKKHGLELPPRPRIRLCS